MWSWIVVLAWMYVTSMMSLAEATAPEGTVLGALITFLFYGVAPLALLMYILGTSARRKARARHAAQASAQPDEGSLPARTAVTPERKEP